MAYHEARETRRGKKDFRKNWVKTTTEEERYLGAVIGEWVVQAEVLREAVGGKLQQPNHRPTYHIRFLRYCVLA